MPNEVGGSADTNTSRVYADYVLVAFLAATMTVGAWLKLNVGPIPYTFQNFGVVLAGLLLSPARATAAVLLYIGMIALGLPVAAGFRGGVHVLYGYTAGYVWGFLLSAPLVSLITRSYLRLCGRDAMGMRGRDVVALTVLSSIGMLPTYLLGYLVFRYYALLLPGLFGWSEAAAGFFGLQGGRELVVLFASVLIFLPQDVLMDHLLAVLSFKRVCRVALGRGIGVEGCAGK